MIITLLLLVRCASADWAVVTGASSGIGEQLALQAAQRGYDVVLHGRRRGALHRLKKAIEAQNPGRSTKMVVEDLSRRNGAKRLHEACKGLDVRLLFANAGVARVQPFIGDDAVDKMLALNVRASTDLCRRFGRDMAEAGGGRVVLTSSLVGVPAHGCAGAAAYAASKAYLRSFGNALHDELKSRKVAVTTVLPGAVDTALQANLAPLGNVSLGGSLPPLDLAATVPAALRCGEPGGPTNGIELLGLAPVFDNAEQQAKSFTAPYQKRHRCSVVGEGAPSGSSERIVSSADASCDALAR